MCVCGGGWGCVLRVLECECVYLCVRMCVFMCVYVCMGVWCVFVCVEVGVMGVGRRQDPWFLQMLNQSNTLLN